MYFLYWILIAGFGVVSALNAYNGLLSGIGYPLNANVAYSDVVFMGIGGFLKDKCEWIFNKLSKLKLVLVAVGFLAVGVITYRFNLPESVTENFLHVEMSISSYGNYLLFIFNACMLSVMVIILSKLMSNKLFEYLGQNTLLILGTHSVSLGIVKMILNYTLPGMTESTVFYLLVSLTVLFVIIPAIPLVNYFIPNLVGKREGIKGTVNKYMY